MKQSRKILYDFFITKIPHYLIKKIVWANRVFSSIWNDSYKSTLCYTVGLLCSDRVKFARNTEAKRACEEKCIRKKERNSDPIGEQLSQIIFFNKAKPLYGLQSV